MDLMLLNRDNYSEGRIVNGWDSVIWIERYDSPGEVTITADPDPELQSLLWPGQMITHVDSETVMMIETHKIDEKSKDKPVLEMKGRTVDVIAMENRVLTMENPTLLSFINGFSEQDFAYDMTAEQPWVQATKIIQDFLVNSILGAFQSYPNLRVINMLSPSGWTDDLKQERSFAKGTHVDEAVYKLIQTGNCGLKLVRPTSDAGSTTLDFVVHKGEDKSYLEFSWNEGDVEDATYLWSNKLYKNSAYVFTEQFTNYIGRQLRTNPWGFGLTLTGETATGWDLKIASVDATDFKPDGFTIPLNPLQTYYMASVLNARGLDVLSQKKIVQIMDATISPTAKYDYLIDYKIGDIVSVKGNYGVDSKMRIVEYAITSDKDGDSGFPTLAAYTETAV